MHVQDPQPNSNPNTQPPKKKSVHRIESEDLPGPSISLFTWKYAFFRNVCDGVVVRDFVESICFSWIVLIAFLSDDHR